MERLAQLTSDTAMAEWSEAQVSQWVSLIDLPDGCAETVRELFSEGISGDGLMALNAELLRKMLRMAGIAEPAPVADAVLRQRGLGLGQ